MAQKNGVNFNGVISGKSSRARLIHRQIFFAFAAFSRG